MIFDPESTVRTLDYVMKLKEVTRAGWEREEFQSQWTKPLDIDHEYMHFESSADHTLGVVFYTRALAMAQGYDMQRCVDMATVHDLAEAIAGDGVWQVKNIPNHEAKRLKDIEERKALDTIFPNDLDEFKQLALEYMAQKTPDAKLVKEADKLEMVHQALRYESFLKDKNTLYEFWENVADSVKSDPARQIYKTLLSKSELTETNKERLRQRWVN